MKNANRVHIGTSGWNYKHWTKVFYPEALSMDHWLEHYAGRFQTVEINNSFYHLPEKKTFIQWRHTVPDDFIYSVKASRYITHMKKLKDPHDSLRKFLDRIEGLESKLGPVLFQLPPRWHFNQDRLQAFLKVLPHDLRSVFEFRDDTWWNDETYSILKEHSAAFCIFELAGILTPKIITAGFVYIRLHGPEAAYQGQYSDQTLSGWAGAISSWLQQEKEVFCYFDNDQNGYAALDALRLKKMVEN